MALLARPLPVGLDRLRQRRVVVLPDIYVDVLVPLPAWADASERLAEIARRGGGNLPVEAMEVRIGGNAANLALGLARLGAQTHLIGRTDATGLHLLQAAAAGLPLDLSHVQVGSEAATTVAMECPDANVMLSHAGPVADFGPERLTDADRDLLQGADAVACVNWSQNRRGTQLLAFLADVLPPSTFLYLDTADPRHRPDAMELVAAVAAWQRIDAWGMNENEVQAFAGPGEHLDAASRLAKRCGTRIDLHTRTSAATVTADETITAEADPTPARRLTGAGDAWNAGNIAGHLLGWPPGQRLEFAHRTATAHVTLPSSSVV